MNSTFDLIDAAAYCERNASGDACLVLSGIAFFMAPIFLPIRVYIRLRIAKCFWWDDVCLIASFVLLIPSFALLWQMTRLGLGRHLGCYPPQNVITATEQQHIADFLGFFSGILARTSVALFVIRLFAITKNLRQVLSAYTAFMTISLGGTACLVFAQCTPAEYIWNPEIQGDRCWPAAARHFIRYYNGAVAILSDLLLALLPAYFLYKLQMKRGLKVAFVLLMAAGLIPGICAIVRTAFSFYLLPNTLFMNSIPALFGSLEASTLVIAATIPALAPLFTRRDSMKSYPYSRTPVTKAPNKFPSHNYALQTRPTLVPRLPANPYSKPTQACSSEVEDAIILLPSESLVLQTNSSAEQGWH